MVIQLLDMRLMIMQKIKLTKGYFALVDDDDFDRLSKTNWCITSGGYAKRGTKEHGKQTVHYMHRQIMNADKGYVVDHINGDKLDNRKSNLRLTNQSVNGHNRKHLNKNNTTGYKGISIDKKRNKYVAEIWINYAKKSARFNNLNDAINQRKAWESKL